QTSDSIDKMSTSTAAAFKAFQDSQRAMSTGNPVTSLTSADTSAEEVEQSILQRAQQNQANLTGPGGILNEQVQAASAASSAANVSPEYSEFSSPFNPQAA